MSRVSISRSYAVLVGLETYVKTRKKLKHGVQHVAETETKLVHPEEHRKKLAEQQDTSESAQKERQLLAATSAKEAAVRRENSWLRKTWMRVRHGSISSSSDQVKLEQAKERKHKKTLSKAGQDVESGISPAGRRDESNSNPT